MNMKSFKSVLSVICSLKIQSFDAFVSSPVKSIQFAKGSYPQETCEHFCLFSLSLVWTGRMYTYSLVAFQKTKVTFP